MTPIYAPAKKTPTTPKNQLEAIKRYNASKKGKQKRKEWLKKNHESVREYTKQYMKQKRKKAKQAKICPHCYKKPSTTQTQLCESCRKKALEYAQKWKSKST